MFRRLIEMPGLAIAHLERSLVSFKGGWFLIRNKALRDLIFHFVLQIEGLLLVWIVFLFFAPLYLREVIEGLYFTIFGSVVLNGSFE